VTAYFYQHPKISIYITKLDVSVKSDSAMAIFQAVLTSSGAAGSASAILPESLGVYEFDVSFSKESDEWKVVSAKWERIGDADKP
jgi:ketosteroid isomerase-like protein